MSPAEKRRTAVQGLIDGRFGGKVADFARAIERSPAQVWQFMNQRGIGEKLARHIELRLDLRVGSLDADGDIPKAAADELELLEAYRRSGPRWQRMLKELASLDPLKQRDELCSALSILGLHLSPDQVSSYLRRRPVPVIEDFMPKFSMMDKDEPRLMKAKARRKRRPK